MTPLRVATALDLPAGNPGGSVELFLDLYTGLAPLIPAQAFMLAPERPTPALPCGLEVVDVPGKCLDEPAFSNYVRALRNALAARLRPSRIDVVHLQHLTFGATPALIRALPAHPRIALVHGTDLLFAEAHPGQLRTLRETVRLSDAIVVPTWAMADRLLRLVPRINRRLIHQIPWGIPDHLIQTPPPLVPRPAGGHLRLLYAGRLTAEKGFEALLRALSRTPGAELSVAAPQTQFRTLMPLMRRLGVRVRYLGWLRRPQLWTTFAGHDALVMPSSTLEAMGLVAVEAQACGLPVLYQPVPGLTDVLGDTALATDFTDPATLARTLGLLRNEPELLTAFRNAGRANAARYPLSTTAAALTSLGSRIT